MRRPPMPVLPLVALIVVALLLAGCDLFGSSPTATPVPPTPTLTPTPPPPTATTPPTATAAATATDANTGATPDAGTPGALVTPSGSPASASDLTLIDDAITTTRALKSYHLKLDLNAMGQTVKGEGNYLAPDRLSLIGNIGGAQQVIIIGSKVYSKEADGTWTESEGSTSGAFGQLSNLGIAAGADLFGTLARFIAAPTQATNVGNETIAGASLSHYSVPIFAGSLLGLGGSTTPGETPVGYADVWIDPATKYIHQVTANVDLSDLFNSLQAFAPTPEAGAPSPTPLPPIKILVDMTVSQFGEPVAIEAPAGVGAATPVPTNTTGAVTTSGSAVTWSDVATAMAGLKSYHATMVVKAVGSTTTTESDVIPPDRVHYTSTTDVGVGQLQTEYVSVGGKSWLRSGTADAMGAWGDPGDVPLGNFGLAFDPNTRVYRNLTATGDETINGTATTHYTFALDPAEGDGPGAASGGTGEAWVAKGSNYLVRMTLKSSVPVAGQITSAEISIDYSRFNDSTISIEEPKF